MTKQEMEHGAKNETNETEQNKNKKRKKKRNNIIKRQDDEKKQTKCDRKQTSSKRDPREKDRENINVYTSIYMDYTYCCVPFSQQHWIYFCKHASNSRIELILVS